MPSPLTTREEVEGTLAAVSAPETTAAKVVGTLESSGRSERGSNTEDSITANGA